MTARRIFVFARPFALFAALLVLIGTGPARAEGTPSDWIADLGEHVVDVLRSTKDDDQARRNGLEDLFLTAFDVEFIGRFVIGRFWTKATDEQKAEFMTVLPDYVATIYAAMFAEYEGDGFRIKRETQTEEGIRVEGVIKQSQGLPDIAAAFLVAQPEGQYLIKNAEVEGVSLLITKRSEFASVLRREGMDALIARIKSVLQS